MIVSSCNDVGPPQAGHSCQSLTIVRSTESLLLLDIMQTPSAPRRCLMFHRCQGLEQTDVLTLARVVCQFHRSVSASETRDAPQVPSRGLASAGREATSAHDPCFGGTVST